MDDCQIETEFLDDDKLIEAVKARRDLFDQNSTNSNDMYTRATLWAQIAKIVGRPFDECKRRRKSLRGSYTKALGRNGGDPDKDSPWYLYRKMSFLAPHIQLRRKNILKTTPTATTPPNAKKIHIISMENVQVHKPDELLKAITSGEPEVVSDLLIFDSETNLNDIPLASASTPKDNLTKRKSNVYVHESTEINDIDEDFLITCAQKLSGLSERDTKIAKITIMGVLDAFGGVSN